MECDGNIWNGTGTGLVVERGLGETQTVHEDTVEEVGIRSRHGVDR